MEAKIFDRETMLDLVVNFIPLGILLFFIAMFAVVTPWGFDVRTSGVMLGLMIVPFVALAVLTYVSAKAIAGDEKTKPLYAQGQAGLEEATPEYHDDADRAVDDGDGADSDTVDADEADTVGADENTVDADEVDTVGADGNTVDADEAGTAGGDSDTVDVDGADTGGNVGNKDETADEGDTDSTNTAD